MLCTLCVFYTPTMCYKAQPHVNKQRRNSTNVQSQRNMANRSKQLKRKLTFMQKDESNVEKPIFQGYMYKEAIGTFHTAFNKRYFVLYQRYLVYYEKEHDFTKDVTHKSLEVSNSEMFKNYSCLPTHVNNYCNN